MKKIIMILAGTLTLTACSTINVPYYIKDRYPTQRVFYVSFQQAHDATVSALKKRGWVVEKESEPGLYEVEKDQSVAGTQTVLFTNIRQTGFLIGSRHVRLNAYIREMADNTVTIEIRYLVVTALPLKSFEDYKNDRAIKRIFDLIENELK